MVSKSAAAKPSAPPAAPAAKASPPPAQSIISLVAVSRNSG